MTQPITSNYVTRIARTAGILYLSMVPLGFAGIFTGGGLAPAGEAAANIPASETLFRVGIVSALLVQVINIFVALALYRLLQPVNKGMARLMVIFILLGAPIAMLNELNRFAALLVLHGSSHLNVFMPQQLEGLASVFLDLHGLGISIAGIFWGLWLFPMGYLVYKSGFLPRILGILLIVGCIGYLVDSLIVFLLPGSGVQIAMYTFWGEILFPLWLVIKGVNVEQWKKRALEPG